MRRSRAPSASCHRPFVPIHWPFLGPGQATATCPMEASAPSHPVSPAQPAPLPSPGNVISWPHSPSAAASPLCSLSSQYPRVLSGLTVSTPLPPFLHEPIPSRLGLHCNCSSRSLTTSMLLSPMADFQSLSNLTYHQQDRPVCPKSSERFLIWLLGLCPLPSAAFVSARRHCCLPGPGSPWTARPPLLLCPGLQAHTAVPGSASTCPHPPRLQHLQLHG